ncbi:DNA cytosine methyltransferase [Spiroplasma poulsonii]|uniref:DNA cytosine methyltransferase n=1 Tax=Spiroplasma poulsonii TaxID=2138 RepID=UPI001F4CAE49|nr:DNA (cytosine-5-)-methyltransferase [Spiroplasma poulsonii]UNF62628.1 DNA (cytosine-5-)-methyltransferase [Spiroplasma poulsonii]
MLKKYKFIDLFAGIGGLSMPFREMGMECVFSSEIDKFAVQTYSSNFKEIPYGDIKDIGEKEIPLHNILIGGFPCQAFSIAGKRKGFDDERGNLFYEITRILAFHKPEVFLLENVKGLTNHDKGNTFKVIQEELINLVRI